MKYVLSFLMDKICDKRDRFGQLLVERVADVSLIECVELTLNMLVANLGLRDYNITGQCIKIVLYN